MRHDRRSPSRSLRGGGTAPLKVWNASIFPHTQFLAISLVVRFLRKKNEMPFCDEADLSGLGIRNNFLNATRTRANCKSRALLRDTWSRRDLPARSGHTDHPFCALRSHDGQAAIGVHATYLR